MDAVWQLDQIRMRICIKPLPVGNERTYLILLDRPREESVGPIRPHACLHLQETGPEAGQLQNLQNQGG